MRLLLGNTSGCGDAGAEANGLLGKGEVQERRVESDHVIREKGKSLVILTCTVDMSRDIIYKFKMICSAVYKEFLNGVKS